MKKIIIIMLLFISGLSVAQTEIDSYPSSNEDSYILLGSAYYYYVGQSFIGKAGTLTQAKFYLMKEGSPTGSSTAYLYAHTGTFGTNGTPTETPIATSNSKSVSSVSNSITQYTFTFVTPPTLVEGTEYVIVIKFTGGNESNYLQVTRDGTLPTHNGNLSTSTNGSSWSAVSTQDLIFSVYGNIVNGFIPFITID
jgi:hypothetical protein